MTAFNRNILRKLSRSRIGSPLNRQASLSEIFHENTKLTPLSALAYSRWIEALLSSAKVRRMLQRPYKLYTLMDHVEMPQPAVKGELCRTIAERRSQRRFTGEAITLAELSQLLFFSYGRSDRQRRFRAVPSGGALYPLELYVVAFRVEGLEAGTYHYGVEHHQLEGTKRGDFRDEMTRLVMAQGIDVEHAALVVIFTAMFQRSTLKYQDRGYRMVLMEAGAAAHGLSLTGHALGLGDCYVGGFLDDQLSAFLDIDGVREAPLLPVVIGRRPASEEAQA